MAADQRVDVCLVVKYFHNVIEDQAEALALSVGHAEYDQQFNVVISPFPFVIVGDNRDESMIRTALNMSEVTLNRSVWQLKKTE